MTFVILLLAILALDMLVTGGLPKMPRRFRRSSKKEPLWDAKTLAIKEHAELSPEFILWAMESDILNHQACHLCGRIETLARQSEKIDEIVRSETVSCGLTHVYAWGSDKCIRCGDENFDRDTMVALYESHLDYGHCSCRTCDKYRYEKELLNRDCGILYDHDPHTFVFAGKPVNCDGVPNY